jgi:hypothetical protein
MRLLERVGGTSQIFEAWQINVRRNLGDENEKEMLGSSRGGDSMSGGPDDLRASG